MFEKNKSVDHERNLWRMYDYLINSVRRNSHIVWYDNDNQERFNDMIHTLVLLDVLHTDPVWESVLNQVRSYDTLLTDRVKNNEQYQLFLGIEENNNKIVDVLTTRRHENLVAAVKRSLNLSVQQFKNRKIAFRIRNNAQLFSTYGAEMLDLLEHYNAWDHQAFHQWVVALRQDILASNETTIKMKNWYDQIRQAVEPTDAIKPLFLVEANSNEYHEIDTEKLLTMLIREPDSLDDVYQQHKNYSVQRQLMHLLEKGEDMNM